MEEPWFALCLFGWVGEKRVEGGRVGETLAFSLPIRHTCTQQSRTKHIWQTRSCFDPKVLVLLPLLLQVTRFWGTGYQNLALFFCLWWLVCYRHYFCMNTIRGEISLLLFSLCPFSLQLRTLPWPCGLANKHQRLPHHALLLPRASLHTTGAVFNSNPCPPHTTAAPPRLGQHTRATLMVAAEVCALIGMDRRGGARI